MGAYEGMEQDVKRMQSYLTTWLENAVENDPDLVSVFSEGRSAFERLCGSPKPESVRSLALAVDAQLAYADEISGGYGMWSRRELEEARDAWARLRPVLTEGAE